MVLGLIVLDAHIHDLARISAGILLSSTHVFMLWYKLKPSGIERLQQVEIDERRLKVKQDACSHMYRYTHVGCNCNKCGKHNGRPDS